MIYQAISSLESGLLATPPERLGFSHANNNGSTIPDTDEDGNVVYPEAKLEIENGLHQLETLLESTVDKTFDKFEIYVLRNILTVPEDLLGWIRLKHYEVGRSCLLLFYLLFNINVSRLRIASFFRYFCQHTNESHNTSTTQEALRNEKAQ